jgi:hypothetical protein
MSEYIAVPVEVDPEDIVENVIEYLQVRWPGWEPNDGNLDVWLLRANALEAAELREIASSVPTSIFRYFGAYLANLPPVDEAPAITTSTWTMIDDQGYTIEIGTQVGIRAAGDELIPFETMNTVAIPPGQTATAVGAIQLMAIEAGADGSGIGAPGGEVELIDVLDFVDTVTMVTATTGGVDAEADDDYLARLREELQLLTPRPIIPEDFAVLAKRVPGVARALVIDNYDPGPPIVTNAERFVTLAAVDPDGNAVSGAIKADVIALLEAMREVNFVVAMIDPTYSNMEVQATVFAMDGYSASEVQLNVEAALDSHYNAATWGQTIAGIQSQAITRDWQNTPVARFLELAQAVNAAEGVAYIVTLTHRIAAGSYVSTDITLPGVAPLPRMTTKAVTVNV